MLGETIFLHDVKPKEFAMVTGEPATNMAKWRKEISPQLSDIDHAALLCRLFLVRGQIENAIETCGGIPNAKRREPLMRLIDAQIDKLPKRKE